MAEDLRWTTAFLGSNPQHDDNLKQLQPDPDPQQTPVTDIATQTDRANQNSDNYKNYLERELQSQLKTLRDKLDTLAKLIYNDNGSIQLKSYTVAGLPSASPAGQLVYVTDEWTGAQPCYSTGSIWKTVIDGTEVTDTMP